MIHEANFTEIESDLKDRINTFYLLSFLVFVSDSNPRSGPLVSSLDKVGNLLQRVGFLWLKQFSTHFKAGSKSAIIGL